MDKIHNDLHPPMELNNLELPLDFHYLTTAKWCDYDYGVKRYKGTWKIENDSLFLVKVRYEHNYKGQKKNPYRLSALFDGQADDKPVFASWVTDTLSQVCSHEKFDACMRLVVKNGRLKHFYKPILKIVPTVELPDISYLDHVQIYDQKTSLRIKETMLNNRFYVCLTVACLMILIRWLYKKFS